MTSVSTTTVTDPSSVNTESAGGEDAESSQGGKPTQLESGNDLTAEEEALLCRLLRTTLDAKTKAFVGGKKSYTPSVGSSDVGGRTTALSTAPTHQATTHLSLRLWWWGASRGDYL